MGKVIDLLKRGRELEEKSAEFGAKHNETLNRISHRYHKIAEQQKRPTAWDEPASVRIIKT